MIVAQISDPHITEVGGEADRKYATAEHLRRAVAHLMALPARPDIVLLTGGLRGWRQAVGMPEISRLACPLSMPVYVIPGNHDDRVHLREAFGTQGDCPMLGFVQYVVDAGPLRLIALDSSIPGQHAGRLCGARLGWLDERLQEEPGRPTLLFLHHPSFQTGFKLLDEMGLEGADELGALVSRYPNVERIVAGHVHCAMQRRFHSTAVAMTCPSTAHQLFLDFQRVERMALVMESPACLLHVWGGATGLVTYTSLIGEQAPVVEVHNGTVWLPSGVSGTGIMP